MANDSPAEEEEIEAETDEEIEANETQSSEAVLDVESAEQQTADVGELRDVIAKQNERIEDLEDTLLDLSTRVAGGDGTGVCPDCNGPVVKRSPLFRRARIECTECGRQFHEY